jgi:uncharacterized membrane-anchored protein YhcB (DUF1043 family)
MNSELIMGLVIGLIVGLILGWIFFRGKKQDGDLSIEGEGALKAETDKLRAENQELKGRISTSETTLADMKSQLSASGGEASATTSDDDTYALEWRNRYLAARVKYLEGRVADAPAAKTKAAPKKRATAKKATTTKTKTAAAKKPAAKKTTAKKPAAKKATAKAAAAPKTKRKPGPKPGTKRGALTASGAPRKKPGPKPGSTRKTAKPKMSDAEAALEKYYANVKKFDPKAKKKVVENIVKYCGVSLRSRDSSLVACSDETELKTVANGFVTKKLGKTSGQMELVKDVCQEMKGERFKSRVTFYYLAAKKARKMSLFN